MNSNTTHPLSDPNFDWFSDEAALLRFGERDLPHNYWSVNDAFQGTQVFGATGSGKSTASGSAIAHAFLTANFGGLVLTAKTDEVREWKKYCKDADRLDDVLVFGDDSSLGFNFLEYELKRSAGGDPDTENLVNLFCSVIEVADRKSGVSANDSYWTRALKQLLRNAIDLILISGEELTLKAIYKTITSAATSRDQAESEVWQNSSYCFGLLLLGQQRATEKQRVEDFEITEEFWRREYPMLAPETRSGFVSMFTTMADCFLRGRLRKLFCSSLDFGPEDSFDGKIIILDLPVKAHHELGIFAQVLFKYVWQRAVERRIPVNLTRQQIQQQVRPVFLWADESQFFVNQYDALFQSTARSSRACTVYLSQNLPSYQAALGGNGIASADAFLGNLQTKILHANAEPKTNQWAAESIGRSRQVQVNTGLTTGEQSRGNSQSSGGSLTYEFIVQPQEFTELRTGGIENDFIVDAIIFQGGRRWLAQKKGKDEPASMIRHSFKQEFKK